MEQNTVLIQDWRKCHIKLIYICYILQRITGNSKHLMVFTIFVVKYTWVKIAVFCTSHQTRLSPDEHIVTVWVSPLECFTYWIYKLSLFLNIIFYPWREYTLSYSDLSMTIISLKSLIVGKLHFHENDTYNSENVSFLVWSWNFFHLTKLLFSISELNFHVDL